MTDCNDHDESDYDSAVGAPFVTLFENEILDNRLTAGARLLIGWLRFRSSLPWGPPSSIKRFDLVQDFGCNQATMSGWIGELKQFGYFAEFSKFFTDSRSLVYFIQQPTGPIKIGKSLNPESRLKALQTSHPETLVLLKSVPGGGDFERHLHSKFSGSRIRGEWFHPTQELLSLIEAL